VPVGFGCDVVLLDFACGASPTADSGTHRRADLSPYETTEIKVSVEDTVWSVYKKIQDQFGIKPHLQQWVVKQWAATDLLAMQTTEQDDEGSQR
jgi:hypothetical protein